MTDEERIWELHRMVAAAERRERALADAIRWHQQCRGADAKAVDHELYRTLEANR